MATIRATPKVLQQLIAQQQPAAQVLPKANPLTKPVAQVTNTTSLPKQKAAGATDAALGINRPGVLQPNIDTGWGDETGLSGPELYQHRLQILQQRQAAEYQKAQQDAIAKGSQLTADAVSKQAEANRLQQMYNEDRAYADAPGGHPYMNARVTDQQLAEALAAAQAAQQAAASYSGGADLAALKAKQAEIYKGADAAVKDMFYVRDTNKTVDAENAANKAKYDTDLADWTKRDSAYQDYAKQKAAYDQNEAQRQADIAAGKYNVDPYQFLKNGASLPEVMELRRQLNAGIANPTMRAPTAAAAPTEVKAAGDRPGDVVPIERVALKDISSDVANALGYKPEPSVSTGVANNRFASPQKSPSPNPTAPAASTPAPAPAPVPSPAPAAPTAPAPAPQPQIPQTTPTQTVQATSQQSASPTQQTSTSPSPKPTAPEPINKATSLAQQTEGNVSGQVTTAQKQQPAPTPQLLSKPKPFAPVTQKEEDNVWEL